MITAVCGCLLLAACGSTGSQHGRRSQAETVAHRYGIVDRAGSVVRLSWTAGSWSDSHGQSVPLWAIVGVCPALHLSYVSHTIAGDDGAVRFVDVTCGPARNAAP